MTSSEKKYYNKKFMPSYMKRMNIALPVVVIAIFVIGVAAIFLLPSDYTTVAVIGLFVALIAALIVLITLTVVFNNKLIKQRKEELENEYTEMSFEDAQAALLARGVITETGIVIPSMAGGGDVIPNLPFKDATVYMFSASIGTKVLTTVSFCNSAGGVMAEYLVDRELYNYLQNAGFNIVYYGGSNLIFGDKGVFVKKVIKNRNSRGLGFAMFGGALGAVLSEKAKDESPETEAVLRVLRKENI